MYILNRGKILIDLRLFGAFLLKLHAFEMFIEKILHLNPYNMCVVVKKLDPYPNGKMGKYKLTSKEFSML